MDLSPVISELLSTLDDLSANTLTRRSDLGMLLELASRPGRQEVLENLSFFAKFVYRTHGIMKRIGQNGEGYEKLAHEFTNNLEKATDLLKTLLTGAPDDVQRHFRSVYFVMTPAGLESYLALFHDLSWYKNWLIDNGAERGERA